jgi:hypothetical protein
VELFPGKWHHLSQKKRKDLISFVETTNHATYTQKSRYMHKIFAEGLIQGVHFILTCYDTVIKTTKLKCYYIEMMTDFESRKMNINLLKPSGHYMYHQLSHSEILCSAHNAFMCSAWISEETTIISLCSLN